MTPHTGTLLVFALACGLSSTSVDASPPLRAQVWRLLSTRHAPPPLATFEALGPEVPALLLEVAADRSQGSLQRGRALLVLSTRPEPELGPVFAEVLADPAAPLVLRRQVVLLLPRLPPEVARPLYAQAQRSGVPELVEAARLSLTEPFAPAPRR